ncbi:MAG: hypothetical protein AABY95_09955 [Pseudomonadota bacterium]
MRKFLLAILLSAATLPAAAEVGVSVTVGQPGFYGHIELGDFPRPRLIFPEPVLIHPVPVAVGVMPMYLRVPPGHERNWARHCRHYNACGRPVYFVEDSWYTRVYAPEYRRHHHDWDDDDRGDGRHHGKKHGKKGKGHKKGRD